MQGEAVHLTVYDAGAELDLSSLGTVLGQQPVPSQLVARAPVPGYVTLPAPLAVHQALEVPAGNGAPVAAEVRLHPLGAIVVRLRIPFGVDTLAALHDLETALAPAGTSLEALSRSLADQVLEAVWPVRKDPYDIRASPEAYHVHVLHTEAPPIDALLSDQRAQLAALVADEPEPGRLADEVVEATLRYALRYYEEDLVVVGWEKAIVVTDEPSYEDVLDVMELANIQLLELRTYDAYLDSRLEAAFLGLGRLWATGGLFRSARTTLADLSEVRMELARLTDDLRDTGKLFGEWYLARLHGMLSARFQLPAWEQAIDKKMATLAELFQMAEEEAGHRRALVLESMIVLLFVLDLLALVLLAR